MMIRAVPLLLLTSACSSVPAEPYGVEDLEPAQRFAAEGSWTKASRFLKNQRREYYDRQAQAELSLLAGDVAWELQDWDQAILHYEEYLIFEGAAATSERIEQRLFAAAMNLLNGDRKALGLFTDRDRGATILMNLATWAPRSPWAAEALAASAQWYFEEERFIESTQAYRMVVEHYPASEYADTATFRIGLADALQVPAHWLDTQRMHQATRQLQHYLRIHPKGFHREQAELVLVSLEEKLASHELMIGDYYRTIDNTRGARLHYREASAHRETAAGAAALLRLEELPADGPLPDRLAEDS